MVKKMVDYIGKAIKSNTGISSLSLLIVTIGIMSIVILIVICVCMLIEVITTHTITASLEGYASIITSIAGLLAAVGLPKALNNWSENKFNNPPEKVDDT